MCRRQPAPAKAGPEELVLLLTFTWVRTQWLHWAAVSATGNGKLLLRTCPPGKDHLWCFEAILTTTLSLRLCLPNFWYLGLPEDVILSGSLQFLLDPINKHPNWEFWGCIFPLQEIQPSWLSQSFFDIHFWMHISGNVTASLVGEPREGGGVRLAHTSQKIFLMLFTFLISVPKIGLLLPLFYSSALFLFSLPILKYSVRNSFRVEWPSIERNEEPQKYGEFTF